MTYQEAKDHLEQLLNLPATGQLLQLNSQTVERAYEGYVASLVAQAARDAGGLAELRGILSGVAAPTTIVFRGGPGRMDSRDQDFCYFFCQLNGHEFEIHLDVKYMGASKAVHEVDVSIFKHDPADRVRNDGGIPKASSALIMTFECKFYEDDPGAVLARTYVGLVQDCKGKRMNGFVANRSGLNLRRYLSKTGRPKPFIDLVPGNAAAEARFTNSVAQELRTWAV